MELCKPVSQVVLHN